MITSALYWTYSQQNTKLQLQLKNNIFKSSLSTIWFCVQIHYVALGTSVFCYHLDTSIAMWVNLVDWNRMALTICVFLFIWVYMCVYMYLYLCVCQCLSSHITLLQTLMCLRVRKLQGVYMIISKYNIICFNKRFHICNLAKYIDKLNSITH